MIQEFKIGKGWAIFVWVFLPLLMGVFGWLGTMPYFEEEFNLTLAITLTLVALGLEILMIIGLIDCVKGKLIFGNNKVISVGVFKTKELDFNNIKGFRQDKNYLRFVPKNKNSPKIKVSSYFGNFHQLLAMTEQEFKNLDTEEFENQEKEILDNVEFGQNTVEREHNFETAKKKTKVLNTISLVTALSLWFYPNYYQFQILICAILPILGLIVYKTSNGLIKLDEKPNSPYPNLYSTLFIPSGALLVRSLLDFTVFDYSNFWQYALILFTVFALIMAKDLKKQYDFKKGATYLTISGYLLFVAMYSYGVVITSNAAFENSESSTYNAEILDKRISTGKRTSYYFKLSQWGPQTEIDEVSVSKEIYNRKEIGESSKVYFNSGLFNIPYYLIIE